MKKALLWAGGGIFGLFVIVVIIGMVVESGKESGGTPPSPHSAADDRTTIADKKDPTPDLLVVVAASLSDSTLIPYLELEKGLTQKIKEAVDELVRERNEAVAEQTKAVQAAQLDGDQKLASRLAFELQPRIEKIGKELRAARKEADDKWARLRPSVQLRKDIERLLEAKSATPDAVTDEDINQLSNAAAVHQKLCVASKLREDDSDFIGRIQRLREALDNSRNEAMRKKAIQAVSNLLFECCGIMKTEKQPSYRGDNNKSWYERGENEIPGFSSWKKGHDSFFGLNGLAEFKFDGSTDSQNEKVISYVASVKPGDKIVVTQECRTHGTDRLEFIVPASWKPDLAVRSATGMAETAKKIVQEHEEKQKVAR